MNIRYVVEPKTSSTSFMAKKLQAQKHQKLDAGNIVEAKPLLKE